MIRISKIYEPNNYHFVTEYLDNPYIEKTIAYACKTDYNRKLIRMGRMEVYLRNGEQYAFESWVTGSYCAQYGIQVSLDGQYIYVISDEKGLWCYTYKGELLWKTRYTSVSYVIPHPDNHITCVTSNKLLILGHAGEVIKQVPLYREGMCNPVSQQVIVGNISETVIALFDSFSLEVLCKISLKKLGLKYFNTVSLSEDILSIDGYSLNRESITMQINLSNDSSIIR